MRLRTTVGLVARAVGATVIGFGTLVLVGLAIAVIGGLVIGSILLIGADQVLDAESVSSYGYGFGTLVSFLFFGLVVRRTFRDSRRRLFQETEPIDPEASGRLVAATHRLAATFDLERPEIRLRHTETPLAYTISWDGRPVLVVSTGLFEMLTVDEAEAVLAHELAHIANGDLRLMTWALIPLVTAESYAEPYEPETNERRFVPVNYRRNDDRYDVFELPWIVIGRLAIASGRASTGLFSRGREFAADRAAVAATGDPAALAAALERLDADTPGQPPEDLREHASSVDALSIIPMLDPEQDRGGGRFATHPATDRRLDRLRRLAAD